MSPSSPSCTICLSQRPFNLDALVIYKIQLVQVKGSVLFATIDFSMPLGILKPIVQEAILKIEVNNTNEEQFTRLA